MDLRKVNELTDVILGAAIKVHRALGPGLLESAYIACLVYELHRLGLPIKTQRKLPLEYGDIRLDCGYRLDIVVDGLVILEIKSTRRLAPIHTAQVLTYLRLTGCPVGLLINFNVILLKHGIRRLLNPRAHEDLLTRRSPQR